MKSVLIVDDDPIVLGFAARAIEKLGVEVVRAASGFEAISLLSSAHEIGLVLSDVQMPRMTGIELHHAMLKNARTRVIPLVLMTGGDANTIAAVPRSLLVLQKPFSIARVRCVVVSYLGGECPAGRLAVPSGDSTNPEVRTHQPVPPGDRPRYCADPCDACAVQGPGAYRR